MGNKESVCVGAKKKRCLDTAGGRSPADTESEHLIPDPESTNAGTEVKGNPKLDKDTDYLDIPDSLTLARVDRENQGPWEAEYSYGGEADLHRHQLDCVKNPGHKDFIPVDKFRIDHLPECYRHKEIVDYIGALADLTVRITVNYVSDRRPVTFPGSDKPYPGYGNRGQRRMAVGTGWVGEVNINLDPQKTCQCKDCRNSSRPETKFAVISIGTANHLVFDDLEAENTTCHLFFDRGGIPDACSGVVTLAGMMSKSSNIETDQYCMEHFTHDLQLGYRLLASCKHKDALMSKLDQIVPQIIQFKKDRKVSEARPMLFIVSHPHGCSKHISIGRLTSIYYTKTGDLTYEYTTATCPGSSGALAVMPHTYQLLSTHQIIIYVPGAHCGTSEEQPGVNYFTAENKYIREMFWNKDYKDIHMMMYREQGLLGMFDRMWMICQDEDGLERTRTRFPDEDGLERLRKFFRDEDVYERMRTYFRNEGPQEDDVIYVDEEDLHRHDDICQKNSGHHNVCPVVKFSADSFPPFYRQDEIMKAIQIV